MLEILLQRNQGEETIKSRIYQFVTEHHPTKPADLVPVLKKAYGIGGARGGLGEGLQGYMSSGKGIELLWTDANGEHEATLTWNKVASILLTLVREGRYSERFPPFPPEEPEWTLFSYAEQVEQSDPLNQHTEQLSSSDHVQNKWEPASSPVSDHSSPSSDSVSTVTAPVISVSTASNYRFDPSRPPYVSGPKSKYKHNVEAIQLLKQLETEQRQASPEEQQILAGYVGWGGLANAFHPTASGWEQEYTELKQLLDEDEYAAARSSTKWVDVGQTSDHLPLNRYYLSHPEKVLGRMVWDQRMYGPEQTTACVPLEDQDLIPALEQALHSLQATFPPPATLPSSLSTELIDTVEPAHREAPIDAKNFTYIIEGTRIYYCENGELTFQDIQGKKAERIKGLCEIRMALLDVIDIQSQEEGYEDAELATAQSRLNQVFDRFVRSYGAINERANTTMSLR